MARKLDLDWSRLDGVRARARAAIERIPGRAGDLARRANEALGRPLADAAELADRRAFAAGRAAPEATAAGVPAPAAAVAAAAAAAAREVAPVVVYHLDKSRRDALRIAELLDGAGVPHRVANLQEDPAALAAVRRDSKGFGLPVVFIAGEAVGGRAELTNLVASGELARRVFG